MEKRWLKNYQQGVAAEINLDSFQSVSEVFEHAVKKFSHRPAVANMDKVLTYAEIDRLSMQFASFLQHELKLGRGSRVAIMMPNLLQYPVAVFGILRAGMTVVNVNPLDTARELEIPSDIRQAFPNLPEKYPIEFPISEHLSPQQLLNLHPKPAHR